VRITERFAADVDYVNDLLENPKRPCVVVPPQRIVADETQSFDEQVNGLEVALRQIGGRGTVQGQAAP
jgi:hypothetical protein